MSNDIRLSRVRRDILVAAFGISSLLQLFVGLSFGLFCAPALIGTLRFESLSLE